jgi:RHS repeat-associated protein
MVTSGATSRAASWPGPLAMHTELQLPRRPAARAAEPRIGFNGELHEPRSGWQFLGSGHRVYSPTLMRFNRPDEWSPFERGGINAYAYCGADPVNHADPDGRIRFKIMSLGLFFTGLTAALGGVKGVVPAEEKQIQRILSTTMIFTGLAAASIGGYYFLTKAFRSRKAQAVADEPIAATATAKATAADADAVPSPMAMGSAPSSSPTRVTFADLDPPAVPAPSGVKNRRASAPAISVDGGRRPSQVLRRDASFPPTSQRRSSRKFSVSIASISHKRGPSVVDTGRLLRKGVEGGGKRAVAERIRKESQGYLGGSPG